MTDDLFEVTETATLVEARAWLRVRLDQGAPCPCCTQHAKVYRRCLSSGTARVMIALHRHGTPGEFVHLTPLMETIANHHTIGGYGTLGHWWGLMEQQPGERDDGSWRTGWWRLTRNGQGFVRQQIVVRKYARIYNGRCLGYAGPDWSIVDALGKRFDYQDLMTS